jgi:hypothetical protein
VTARSVSEPVDIESGRRDIEARLERAAIVTIGVKLIKNHRFGIIEAAG